MGAVLTAKVVASMVDIRGQDRSHFATPRSHVVQKEKDKQAKLESARSRLSEQVRRIAEL